MRKLVMGNWKMNGSLAMIADLITEIKSSDIPQGVDCVICPPNIYIPYVQSSTRGTQIILGAQNIHEKDSGAYTGEVSGNMLAEYGVQYVLVGHSERREYANESNEEVARKFISAKRHGLIPVLCVGETQAQRQSGLTQEVIASQLRAVFDHNSGFENAVIAYEPVWAIGTGLSATPQEAEAVHKFIREQVAIQQPQVAKRLQILYGGSLKLSNAAQLFAQQNIDGGLIGGASLNATEFLSIAKSF